PLRLPCGLSLASPMFSFEAHGDPRALPSFPTRRSSDLVEEHHRVGPAPHLLRQLPAFLVAHIAGRRTDEPGHGVALHVLGHVQGDRKSTRLNSSHVKISYAVFCLKKKKKKTKIKKTEKE